MTDSLEKAESNGDAGQQNDDGEREKGELCPTQKTEEKRCCEGREHELPSCTRERGNPQPICFRTTLARSSATSLTMVDCSPSTMIRNSGSVPEYLIRTRPHPFRRRSLSCMAQSMSGMDSNRGFFVTCTFTNTCGTAVIA